MQTVARDAVGHSRLTPSQTSSADGCVLALRTTLAVAIRCSVSRISWARNVVTIFLTIIYAISNFIYCQKNFQRENGDTFIICPVREAFFQ